MTIKREEFKKIIIWQRSLSCHTSFDTDTWSWNSTFCEGPSFKTIWRFWYMRTYYKPGSTREFMFSLTNIYIFKTASNTFEHLFFKKLNSYHISDMWLRWRHLRAFSYLALLPGGIWRPSRGVEMAGNNSHRCAPVLQRASLNLNLRYILQYDTLKIEHETYKFISNRSRKKWNQNASLLHVIHVHVLQNVTSPCINREVNNKQSFALNRWKYQARFFKSW